MSRTHNFYLYPEDIERLRAIQKALQARLGVGGISRSWALRYAIDYTYRGEVEEGEKEREGNVDM